MYAADLGISTDEAGFRLALQEDAGVLEQRLVNDEASTFAGLWIEHEPEFRVIVQFVDGGPEGVSTYVDGTPLAGKVDVRQAKFSLRELTADAAFIRLSAPSVRFDSNIDVYRNRVEIMVESQAGVNAFSGIQLPDSAVVSLVGSLSKPTANIYGGLALSPCTSGFSVSNSSRQGKGVTTAGHCDDTVYYQGTLLPYGTGGAAGSLDVQWMSTPGYTDKNWAYDGIYDSGTPYYRTITATRSRDGQALDSFVCKYGKASGYKCGYLISKTHAPSYIPNANNTFMVLHRDGQDLSISGDSGGPIYSGSTAYGVNSGETGSNGNDAIYMAINYVSAIGISVLTH